MRSWTTARKRRTEAARSKDTADKLFRSSTRV
jgi:hypothetical protein